MFHFPTGKRVNDLSALTDACCSNEARGRVRRLTGGEQRLHQVVGEGDGDDGLAGGLDDEERCPESNKCQKASEWLQDVGIAGARLGDGGAQFSVTQSADHGEDSPEDPDNQRKPVGATVEQHTFRRHEDPRADHVSHDKADAIQERDLLLQLHRLSGPRLFCSPGTLSV